MSEGTFWHIKSQWMSSKPITVHEKLTGDLSHLYLGHSLFMLVKHQCSLGNVHLRNKNVQIHELFVLN